MDGSLHNEQEHTIKKLIDEVAGSRARIAACEEELKRAVDMQGVFWSCVQSPKAYQSAVLTERLKSSLQSKQAAVDAAEERASVAMRCVVV